MHTIQAKTHHSISAGRWSAMVLITGLLISLASLADAKGPRDHRPVHHDRGYTQAAGYRSDDYDYRYPQRYLDIHHYRRGHVRHDIWEAEQRKRAHRYAERAVEQAREARWYGYYFNSPRWTTRYRSHLRWALRAHSHELRQEIRARERRLAQIRHEASWQYQRPYQGYGPRYRKH